MEGFRVRNQGNILFIYRKGLIDLYAERTFGPNEAALLGDYLTAVYRFVGSPEASEATLPEAYLAEDPEKLAAFGQSNQHDAVCWAFAQGLIRPDDRRTDYTIPLDNVEICLLLYRTAELLELRDLAVDQTMIDSFEADNVGITDQEIHAVVWAIQNSIIQGNSAMNNNLFDDIPENVVTRYRLVLFLLKLLYPEIVI